ncbi:MAG TPA: phosphotransferase [Pyrinomonadaceae bacterium]|jgi:Ser/Thr protein kinase RdoA (MazF antagonist)|nr:phosphotransferase [Pyrinomonadaceae bacterium]
MRAVLEHAPRFTVEAAVKIADEFFGVRALGQSLPSERDQNFLLTDQAGEKFVLKIANALESRAFLEAENAVLQHVARRVSFCQSPLTTEIVNVEERYFARLVRYLPGVPFAKVQPQPHELLRDLGCKLGQLDQALSDFDHPAVHRDFHWDLANGNRIIDEYAALIEDVALREVVLRARVELKDALRTSVIHGDANDYNVLVDPERMIVTGLLDFGDMVYSYTVGDLAIAIAYVVLDKPDPRAAADEVIEGYTSEFELLDEELEMLWPLVRLRLAMSVCIAAYQLREQPENEYLRISQRAIEKSLPRI